MARLLIVDDDKVTLKVISSLLKEAEIDHLCAETPQQALDLLQTNQVSLLLTDLVMPEMDGVQLFAEARRQRPMLRGILCSAHLDYETLLRVIEAGFDDCFLKPLRETTTLLTAVHDSLGRQQQWRARIAELRGVTSHGD